MASPSTDHVDLLLLPELFTTGYYIGERVRTEAETRDGPTARAISGLARDSGVAIHYGYSERDGDRLYNAAQGFGSDGARLGHQRKLVLPPGLEHDHFTPGRGISDFSHRGLKFATPICFDAEYPEIARAAAVKGADVLLVPTALGAQWGWVARNMVPTRAYENGVFFAYANSAGTENGMSYLGESLIAAANGEELARAGPDPQVIQAELDPRRIIKARTQLPYLEDRLRVRLD